MTAKTERVNRKTSRAFIICGLASLFYFYEFFFRVIPSVISHELMTEFNLGTFGVGIFMSMFYWGYTPMQIPAGLLLDRFGPKRVLTIALLICAVSTFVFALTHSLTLALIARFMIGLGSSFAYLGALILASRWFEAKYFALCAGSVQILGCIGALVGQAPVALATQEIGWRSTMHYAAITCCILSILFLFFIQDHPKNSDIKPKNKTKSFCLWEQLKVVCHNKQVWAISLYAFTIWGPMTIIAESWGARFLMSKFDYSSVEAASALSIIWVGVAIGGPLMGWWSSRQQSRCQPLWAGSILGLITTTAIIYLPISLSLLLVCLFLFGVAASSQAVTFGLIHDHLPAKVAGTAVGFNNMAVIFGGITCQPLTAYLLEAFADNAAAPMLQDYQKALIIIPVLYLVGMILHAYFVQETHCCNQHEELAHDH